MKVLYIAYIDLGESTSGSKVRPLNMLKAFREAGHEIKLLAVSQKRVDWPRRRAAVAEISEWLDRETPELCYIESPVDPILLPCDYALIRKLHRKHIPTGYFYRDFYHKFPEVFPKRRDAAGWMKDTLQNLLRRCTDRVLRNVDIVYLPAEETTGIFSFRDMRPLPPAGQNRLEDFCGEELTVIYVGGVVYPYGGALLLEAFQKLNDEGKPCRLILVTRDFEWEALDHPLKNAPWLEVYHTSGDGLIPLYRRASAAMVVNQGVAYDDVAVSVKLYEYLGYGLPVVACGSRSMERIVTENGFGLRADCEAGSLAQAVLEVLSGRETYAAAARETLLRNGLWSHRVQQITEDLTKKQMN